MGRFGVRIQGERGVWIVRPDLKHVAKRCQSNAVCCLGGSGFGFRVWHSCPSSFSSTGTGSNSIRMSRSIGLFAVFECIRISVSPVPTDSAGGSGLRLRVQDRWGHAYSLNSATLNIIYA